MKHIKYNPLISVIMTAYNAGHFIGEALKSIIDQTYKNIEIIIVDDGSADDTWKRISAFQKRYRYIRAFRFAKNKGPSTASNFALSKAKGVYVARMDSDDIAFPDRIEKQVQYLENHPLVLLVGGQCTIIDEQGKVIGEKQYPLTHEAIYQSLFMINPIQHPTWMFRLDTFKKYGINYEKKYFVSHDLQILFKLLPYGILANLPDTLIYYRYRPESITHRNSKRTFYETADIRHWALLKGAYVPTLRGVIFHIVELLLVAVLPNRTINALFQLWRIHKTTIAHTWIAERVRFAYQFGMQMLIIIFILFLSMRRS